MVERTSKNDDGATTGCGTDAPGAAGAMRCVCGALLARLVPGGVELKCRRCKRTQVVPLQQG